MILINSAKIIVVMIVGTIWLMLDLPNAQAKNDKHSSAERTQGVKTFVRELPAEVFVPRQAWELLALDAVEVQLAEIAVLLTEKNEKVLSHGKHQVQFARGGGRLDFASLRGPIRGTFFLRFDSEDFLAAKEKRILFVSRSKKRTVVNDVFGAGCNSLVDLTDKAKSLFQGEGLRLNTTEGAHALVTGGTFLISYRKNKDVFVTQITFTDSDYLNDQCE